MDLPAIVIEGDRCPDAERAEAALRDALASVNGSGYRVHVKVRFEGGVTKVVAELDGPDGPLSHRDLQTAGRRCESLARGAGVWAALALDAEHTRLVQAQARAKADSDEAQRAAKARSANANGANGAGTGSADAGAGDPGSVTLSNDPNAETDPVKRAARANASADAAAPRPDKMPTLELGVSSTMTTGYGSGAAPVVGADVFAQIHLRESIFLRPALGFGAGMTNPTSVGRGRVDACLRIPGNYIDRRGLELDTCLGVELGGVRAPSSDGIDRTRFIFTPGPALALRGAMTRALSIEIRGTFGFNIPLNYEADLLNLRAEIGLTWGVL
jgi:hypothetical protein